MADSPDIDMRIEGDGFDDSPASAYDAAGGIGGGGDSQQQQQQQHQQQQQQQHQPKRTRVLLSCAPCRISKLKCDRESPCSNCLKKDRVDLCEYAPRPKKPAKPAKGMAARLRRLEGMLREMMDDDSAAAAMSKFGVSSAEIASLSGMDAQLPLTGAPPHREAEGPGAAAGLLPLPLPDAVGSDAQDGTASASAQQAQGKGRVVRGQRATTYVGATHFMAMLDDIDDLKAYFEDPEDEPDDDGALDASGEYEAMESLMMGAGGAPPGRLRTKADLLRLMPSRSVTDRLITRFFNSHTPSQHVLHRPTFTKQYKAFWEDRAGVDNAFLAVIFVILELGVHFSTFSAPRELELDDTHMTPVERYRAYRAAASCALTLTRFTNPSTATLQAMVIFIEAEFLVNRVSQTNCFLLLGVCIRIMLKMGLHRDPSRLPSISAFEGEIRRRLWNLAIQLDLIVSFYLGLPSMIHGIPSDTSLVHNLLDEDFDEDSPELPPPRPETEYTTMSYAIFKSMVCHVFGQVARLSHTLTPPRYGEIMRTDRLLEDKWRQVPQFMKVRPVDDCVADPPLLVVQRFGIASLYQRSRCVLHRPYLLETDAAAEHAYSRRACFQAALALLEYHRAVHEATQPGAVLHQIGWFITGLGMHDFLLAAMIVYIVVQNESKFEPELLVAGGGSGGGGSSRSAPTVSSTTTVSPASNTTASAGSATTTTTTTSSATDKGGPANYGTHARLPVERGVLVDMLRRSYEIWAEVAQKNSDAVKAAELVGTMLRKIYSSEVRENDSPPNWSPPVDPRHSQPHRTQEPEPEPEPHASSGFALQAAAVSGSGGSYYGEQPTATAGAYIPLSESSIHSLGMGSMPVNIMGLPLEAMAVGEAQMGFSRRDLVPQVPQVPPVPPVPQQTGTMPTRYDLWMPLSLDNVDWNTVDTGIRVSSQQTNEWTTEDSVLTDMNYAAANFWDHAGMQ